MIQVIRVTFVLINVFYIQTVMMTENQAKKLMHPFTVYRVGLPMRVPIQETNVVGEAETKVLT